MTHPLNILLVEDSEDDEIILRQVIRKGGLSPKLHRVEDEASFRAALQQGGWDLVISDYSLPSFNAVAALEIFREGPHDIPFIVVSGRIGEETAVEMLRIGADDYLLKNNLRRLVPSIQRAIKERAASRQHRATEWITQRILSCSLDVITVLDPELHFVQVSAAGRWLMGRDPLQIRRSSLLHYVHPDERHQVQTLMQRLMSGASSANIEFRIVNQDTLQSHSTQWSCNWSPQDKLIFAVGRDITELKHNQQQQQLLTAVLDATPDCVGIFTPDSQAVFLNRAARNHLGLTTDNPTECIALRDMHPQWVNRLIHAEALPTARRVGFWSGETCLLRCDGTELPVAQTIIAHFTPDGTVKNYSTLIHDISHLKRLEEQMRQSQKMEAVGQLAGGVAHDFNNLLTIISGYSDLLMRSIPADDPLHHGVVSIHEASDRAASLTKQLLTFSRKAVITPQTVELNQAVRETEKLLRRLIGEDISLLSQLTDEPLPIQIDPGQFNQILMNLCVNARDAMPTGGQITIHTVSVQVDRESNPYSTPIAPGRYAQLTVSDNGSGMTTEIRSRIFDPFFTTKGVGKGTGLGLSVVHGIVEQNAGLVEVVSQPGVGSDFHLLFPLAVQREENHSDQPTQDLNGTETLLLVEDEDAVRALASIILRKKGYRVLEASHGGGALKIAQETDHIDMLVTDVVMPAISGHQLSQEFLRCHPKAKVLFMSGYTDDAILRYGILRDEADFIHKPFNPNQFLEKVRDVLNSDRRPNGQPVLAV